MTNRTFLVAYWLVLVAILLVIVPLGTFVVPSMVPGWKAQGLKEAPALWQMTADLAEFFVHRWFIWLPIYIAIGAWLRAGGRRRTA